VIELWKEFTHISFSVQSNLDWCKNDIMDINEFYLLLISNIKRNRIMS
jgi:hypothetical protein